MAEMTEERIELWVDLLQYIDFAKAQANLREHIKVSKFPPTIAEIVRQDAEQALERLTVEETQARIEEMRRTASLAIDCPPHLIPHRLKGGVIGD